MQSDFIIALVIVGSILALSTALAIKVWRRANAVRAARHATTQQARAETLVRAYGLAKSPPHATRDAAAEHIRRLARLREHQRRQSTQPAPVRNPGPCLRPHPIYSDPAFVIQPAIDPIGMPAISTADTADPLDTPVIHTLTLPIGGGEQAGDFSGAGASGCWSSGADISTPYAGD